MNNNSQNHNNNNNNIKTSFMSFDTNFYKTYLALLVSLFVHIDCTFLCLEFHPLSLWIDVFFCIWSNAVIHFSAEYGHSEHMKNCPSFDNFGFRTEGDAITGWATLCIKGELLGGLVDHSSLTVLFLFFKTSLGLEKRSIFSFCNTNFLCKICQDYYVSPR